MGRSSRNVKSTPCWFSSRDSSPTVISYNAQWSWPHVDSYDVFFPSLRSVPGSVQTSVLGHFYFLSFVLTTRHVPSRRSSFLQPGLRHLYVVLTRCERLSILVRLLSLCCDRPRRRVYDVLPCGRDVSSYVVRLQSCQCERRLVVLRPSLYSSFSFLVLVL
jgi:hypothetical protein